MPANPPNKPQSSAYAQIPPNLPRGLLIVLEGLDRSGKSTQCNTLVSTLESHSLPTRLQKFPDRSTSTGALINAYLTNQTETSDHTIHLLFSANRWEARSRILEDLRNGVNVVVDRYGFSGAVYSAAKGNPDLGVDWAWSCEVGLPMPDLVVFLDVSSEVASTRGGYGAERYEKEEMQSRVRGLFGEVFARLGGVPVELVDAGAGVEEVADRIWGCVLDALWRIGAAEERREVGRLTALNERES